MHVRTCMTTHRWELFSLCDIFLSIIKIHTAQTCTATWACARCRHEQPLLPRRATVCRGRFRRLAQHDFQPSAAASTRVATQLAVRNHRPAAAALGAARPASEPACSHTHPPSCEDRASHQRATRRGAARELPRHATHRAARRRCEVGVRLYCRVSRGVLQCVPLAVADAAAGQELHRVGLLLPACLWRPTRPVLAEAPAGPLHGHRFGAGPVRSLDSRHDAVAARTLPTGRPRGGRRDGRDTGARQRVWQDPAPAARPLTAREALGRVGASQPA